MVQNYSGLQGVLYECTLKYAIQLKFLRENGFFFGAKNKTKRVGILI